MRCLILAFVSICGLAGCDAYISTRDHEALTEVAKHTAWVKARADGRDETIREVGTVITGQVPDGGEETVTLDVTGAHRSIVIAACDNNCSDLDLRVVTEDGRLIGLDEDDDDSPSVYINEKKTNKLVLKVRMPQCSASSCSFAVKQLEYEDYVGGYGSCFAVSPNGLLMTSFHVVDGASKINISFPDGRKGEAEIVRSSEDNDLALLQTKLPTPAWLPLAKNDDVLIGTPAFTMGFPAPDFLGSEVKLTEGSVSSLSGLEESTLLQVSIPIQGGSSGGPVINYSGQVLGVVEGFVEEDNQGEKMQLINFARHARVASLLLPTGSLPPVSAIPANREAAIQRALKAVCQIKVE
ncbi:MAG: trypsin-like peptidase domain-containing protein [Betaproteobacteria bacterium]|nr:trypsin-like peptidase domain-containing protein [Betaproteobacteria bacterium]